MSNIAIDQVLAQSRSMSAQAGAGIQPAALGTSMVPGAAGAASPIPVDVRVIPTLAAATDAAVILPPPAAAPGGALADSLALAERQLILRALRAHASRERAAAELGISARTLRYKLARLRAAGVDLSDEIQMAGSAA